MKAVGIILILAAGIALSGCATGRPNYHAFKLDQPFEQVIADPCDWTLQQFADGPISGAGVSEYARIVVEHGLQEASEDLNGDGVRELLLRSGLPGRVFDVLVFSRAGGGYRYLGNFPASWVVPDSGKLSVLVYEACGGHYGFIKSYRHDGQRFVCRSAEEIRVGDGAPDENNRRLGVLFPEDRVIKWKKAPNKASHAISKPAPSADSSAQR